MSLLNSKINSIEGEVGDLAEQLVKIQTGTSSVYTKAQIDTALGQKQALVTVSGNDTNFTTGFKLLDANNNLRSIVGVDPYIYFRSTTTPSPWLDRRESVPMGTTRPTD